MISMIFAMGRHNALGRDNKMPWYLPADFQYFKRITMGKPVIMGRKTFESLGKPLPGRTNIVITRNRNFAPEGCQVVDSVECAAALVQEQDAFIIGGAEIYKAFMPHAHKLYITEIDEDFEVDSYFPEIDYSRWKLVSSETGPKDEKNPYDYRWLVYERVK